ncbi:reverse transcriptase [Gossypium australe]|uniref:Reverse transcriptase n=1 Tax=Gossypium australe TaxID=47621 RepID=A0A5B6WCF0_9ROSI|nr:reverse transcriptase [Gossypium australe]
MLCKPKYNGGLGFKNLSLFSKALLAKQVWRILVQPQCLLARVKKARSFLFTDILAAKRVGKRDRVNIWNDPWLLGRENNRVSGHEIRSSWTTVNQLMEAETNTWNRELISSLVDEITAARILAIPISSSRTEDTLVWKYEGSRVYIVKSGYRVLATYFIQTNTYSPNEDVYKEFYKALWSLNILEKIKIHNWRLFNNLLPHFGNLARSMLSVDSACPLCKVELEDSNHLLWFCDTLQCVWSHLQVKIPVFEDSLCSKMHFARTFSTADEQQRRIIAISLWSLWYRRNKLIHEGVNFTLQEWPPEEGLIKLNFDASFQRDDRIATAAVIARDSTGEIRGAETYLIVNVADAFMAEARACKRALIFALSMGFQHLVVEGDSLSVIKSIKKKGQDKSVIKVFCLALFLEKVRLNLQAMFKGVVQGFSPTLQMASISDVRGRCNG